jgi:hypothetical protein
MMAVVLAAVAVAWGPVRAENRGITGRKLVIVDRTEFSNRAVVRFLSVDALVSKGFGTSTGDISAAIDITIEAPQHPLIAGSFDIPEGFSTTAGWRVNNSTIAKFANPGAPGGPTQVRFATIQQSRLIKLSAKGLGDLPINLDDLRFGPYHVEMRFTLNNGTESITHCTLFRSDNCLVPAVGSGTGRKLQCSRGEAVPDCLFPPPPGGGGQ